MLTEYRKKVKARIVLSWLRKVTIFVLKKEMVLIEFDDKD